ADRHDAALARFDELVLSPVAVVQPRPIRRRVRPNAATAYAERYCAAIAERDTDALPALFTDDMETVHHPTHSVYRRDGSLNTCRSMIESPGGTFAAEPLAALGGSLALCRQRASARAAGGRKFDFGPYEIELVWLVEVDEQGRQRRAEFFATDR